MKKYLVSALVGLALTPNAFAERYDDSTGIAPDPVVMAALPNPTVNVDINNSYNDIINHQIDRRLNDIVGILTKHIDDVMADNMKKLDGKINKLKADLSVSINTGVLGASVVQGGRIKEGGIWLSDKYLGINGKAKTSGRSDSSGHADSATNATHASRADYANNAGHASRADYANNAGHANTAGSANNVGGLDANAIRRLVNTGRVDWSKMPSGSTCGTYVMSGGSTRVNVLCQGRSVRSGCPSGFTRQNFGYFEAGDGDRMYLWCSKN